MELEEAMKEMKIEIEEFETDLKALEKTDIDVEYKIQIVNELTKYIRVRQTILNHITKQEKMIDLMISKIDEYAEHDDEMCMQDNYYCDEDCKTCIRQYFEKKAEESE